jgi:CRP-like cAMP-binding protein
VRKGLARGSLAMLDLQQAAGSESSQAFLKPAPKAAEEEAYLRQMLHDHPQFRLPPEKFEEALSYFRKRDVAEGEVLISQGQTGMYFFVVQSGTYALKVPAKPAERPGEDAHPEQTVRRYAPHAGIDSTFGEISLVSGAKPYGGFIVARSAGQVWALDKRAYKASVQGGAATPSRVTMSD